MKKKIIFLTDDPRSNSGVGTISREIILSTVNHYDWVIIGGAISHPDKSKVIDLSDSANTEANILDAYVKLYPVDRYGDWEIVKEVIGREGGCDGIMFMTDPRFWDWLFNKEHEVRQNWPFIYYNIWDAPPVPLWNRAYYKSCDLLMCISKQTEILVKHCLGKGNFNSHGTPIVDYVPHGVDENAFYPIYEKSNVFAEFNEFKNKVFGNDINNHPKFVVTFVNRNVQRKHPGTVILSYRLFIDRLSVEDRKKCLLILHTNPQDPNGVDLIKLVKDLMGDEYPVVFSTQSFSKKHMNFLYNLTDVTINIASNEGFGLSTLESLMAGTMILVNVTGGLQDQCRFEDEKGNWINFGNEFVTNSIGKYKKCGEWAIPIFPKTRMLMGSIPTPYIYDERVDMGEVTEKLFYIYSMNKEERKRRGLLGREWVNGDESKMSTSNLGKSMIRNIDWLLGNFVRRERFSINKIKSSYHPEFLGI